MRLQKVECKVKTIIALIGFSNRMTKKNVFFCECPLRPETSVYYLDFRVDQMVPLHEPRVFILCKQKTGRYIDGVGLVLRMDPVGQFLYGRH